MARSTVNVDVQIQTKSIDQLEQELQGINEQLKKADIGSKAFTELSTKAQGLTKELDKANSAAEGFTDDKKFMAADGAIKAMAGSVSGVVGALGLLGVESEAFGEMEKKAASAIAVSMGIKDVSEGFNQLRKSTVLAGIATQAYNVAVTAGNKIMKLFNITMALNPVGVLIVALTTVAGLVYAFRDSIMNLIKKALGPMQFIVDKIVGAFTSLGETLGIVDDAQTKQTKANIERMERELAVAQAKGDATLELEQNLLLEKRKLLEEGSEEYEQSITDELVLDAKATKEKEDNAQAVADKKDQIRKDQEAKDKAQADKDKAAADKKIADDKAAEEARVDAIEGILAEFVQRQEDIDADTRVKKVDLAEERKLEDLLALAATEEEIDQVKAFFKEQRKEAELLDEEETKEKEAQNKADMFTSLNEQIEAEYTAAQDKIQAKGMVVDAVAMFAGQETAIGKAAFIAQQFLRLQDLKASASATLKKIALDAAGAGVDLSKGFFATLKAGFPQNIPFLIAYAAQAAALVGSMGSALSKTKAVGASVGGGADIPTLSSVSVPTGGGAGAPAGPTIADQASQAPQPTMVNQSVRAYVVTGDVNTAQEAEARLNRRRSLG